MYSTIELSYKFVLYYLKALNGKGHGVHSPFVFDFVTKVLNQKNSAPNFNAIELCRSELKQNTKLVDILDRGAGSRQLDNKVRSIRYIARTSLKSKKYSQLLYRMAVYYKPSHVLEMGTSFGITSSYLAAALNEQPLVTMEGAPAIAAEARNTFNRLNIHNINLIEGDFDKSLPLYLNSIQTIGMVYIDGNHRYEPTMNYFKMLLGKVTEDSILIFDDIYWSAEMEKAWNEIKAHAAVTLTVDLFHIGIVFFRKENRQKEHFVIRY